MDTIKQKTIVILCFWYEKAYTSIPTITHGSFVHLTFILINWLYKQYLIIINYNIHHITLMTTIKSCVVGPNSTQLRNEMLVYQPSHSHTTSIQLLQVWNHQLLATYLIYINTILRSKCLKSYKVQPHQTLFLHH